MVQYKIFVWLTFIVLCEHWSTYSVPAFLFFFKQYMENIFFCLMFANVASDTHTSVCCTTNCFLELWPPYHWTAQAGQVCYVGVCSEHSNRRRIAAFVHIHHKEMCNTYKQRRRDDIKKLAHGLVSHRMRQILREITMQHQAFGLFINPMNCTSMNVTC